VAFAVRPSVPHVTGPLDGAVNDGTRVPVAGTGVEAATVTAYEDITALGSFLVAGGAWAGEVGLGYGVHSLTFAQSKGGQTSARTAPIRVTVRPRPPTLTATTQAPSPVTVSGTAVAGAEVTIWNGVDEAAALLAGSNGDYTGRLQLAPGTYQLSATQTVNSQESAASASVTTVVLPEPTDAGTAADAGTRPDAGTTTDGGTRPDAGTGTGGGGGGCAAPTGSELLFPFALLGLALRRRSREDP
jgi:hypothetical protein